MLPFAAMAMENDTQSDAELVQQAGRGDEFAFRLLTERHSARAYRFARRMLGTGDAEDIVQEAFLRVWREAPRWQPRAQFSTWLRRIVYHLCIDHLRSTKRSGGEVEEDIADTRPNAEQAAAQSQMQQQMRSAVAALPEAQRAAIALYYDDDMPQAEIAEILGLSIGAVEGLLFRARRSLKESLRSQWN